MDRIDLEEELPLECSVQIYWKLRQNAATLAYGTKQKRRIVLDFFFGRTFAVGLGAPHLLLMVFTIVRGRQNFLSSVDFHVFILLHRGRASIESKLSERNMRVGD